MLCERSQRNDRDRGIDIVDGASEQIGRGRFISRSERTKPNKKGNVALESTRERQVNSAGRFLFEERVARCRHDADYFDCLLLLLLFTHIRAPSGVGTSVLDRRRTCPRILNALSKRITIRPELLCQNFVNNRHLWTGLSRLRFGERATPNHRQSNG